MSHRDHLVLQALVELRAVTNSEAFRFDGVADDDFDIAAAHHHGTHGEDAAGTDEADGDDRDAGFDRDVSGALFKRTHPDGSSSTFGEEQERNAAVTDDAGAFAHGFERAARVIANHRKVAGAFQVPVTGRIEFSPNQKFDIGLEFTLLNVKPPEGQSPIDNRFIALFAQTRVGK